jgi:hypothetical protein
LLGSYNTETGGFYATVEIAGLHAFAAADHGHELLVLDVSNPSAPTLAARVGFSAAVNGLSAQGDAAYETTGSEVRVLDLSNPAQPTEVGRYPSAGSTAHVAGGRLIVSAGYEVPPDNLEGFWDLMDVSDPRNPRLLHHEDTPAYIVQAKVAGNRAWFLQEQGSTSSNSKQFQVIDLTDTANPVPLGTCILTNIDCQPLDFEVTGQYAYVADGANGLLVVDFSDAAHPAQTATVPLLDCTRVRVAGRYAYVACRGWNEDALEFRTHLQVLDLINPAHPAKVAVCDLPIDSVPMDLCLAETYALLALGDAGMHVIDIGNPLSPAPVATYVRKGYPASAIQAVGTTRSVCWKAVGCRCLN